MFTRHPDRETDPGTKLDLDRTSIRVGLCKCVKFTIQSFIFSSFSHYMYFHCFNEGTWYTSGCPPSNSEDNLESSLSLSIGSTVFKAYLVGAKSNFIYPEKCLAFSTDGSKITCKKRDKIIVMDAESGEECNSENTFESYVH